MGDKIERVGKAIDRLNQSFAPERKAYLWISIISSIFVVVAGVSLVLFLGWQYFETPPALEASEIADKPSPLGVIISALGLFGSAGPITYSIGRILQMYFKGTDLVLAAIEND
jgi:hypothetical protein